MLCKKLLEKMCTHRYVTSRKTHLSALRCRAFAIVSSPTQLCKYGVFPNLVLISEVATTVLDSFDLSNFCVNQCHVTSQLRPLTFIRRDSGVRG